MIKFHRSGLVKFLNGKIPLEACLIRILGYKGTLAAKHGANPEFRRSLPLSR